MAYSGGYPSYGETPSGYDPVYQAQVAEQQSAYSQDHTYAYRKTTGGGPQAGHNSQVGPYLPQQQQRHASKPKIITTATRKGGGEVWQDPTLLDWDPSHFRLFCGDLGGEVTDDGLLKAFGRYPSVMKARVIRDKKTTKSKGYGFVSFSDPTDFMKAWKEMNGKYIGSHPVKLRKATTEIKPVQVNLAKLEKHRMGKKKGKKPYDRLKI